MLKKILASSLLMMLLACAALADTDKPIAFAEFSFGDWLQYDEIKPVCFSAKVGESRKVAGQTAGLTLWFVYPVENGEPVLAEDDALFYAGEYDFWEGDAQAIFDELKDKLIRLYGEPAATDLNDAFGRPNVRMGMESIYLDDVKKYQAQYVVWTSSANGASVVLKTYMANGE